MAMNMRADFDVFAAELLDQIEAVQALQKALAPVVPAPSEVAAEPSATDVPVLDVEEADRDAWCALAKRVAVPNPFLRGLTG